MLRERPNLHVRVLRCRPGAVLVALLPLVFVPCLSEGQSLELGRPLDRSIASGETHAYRLTCRAGDYVHAVVEQRGVDVALFVLAPDGSRILDIDTPTGRAGRETALFIAPADGEYLLQVRAAGVDPGATYELRLEAQRRATPEDVSRAKPWRLWSEARRLMAERSAASVRQALGLYEQCAELFLGVGAPGDAAMAFGQAAQVAGSLGEDQRAVASYRQVLELTSPSVPSRLRASAHLGIANRRPEEAFASFEQALGAFRALGDARGEAAVLNGLALAYDEQKGDSTAALELLERVLELSRSIPFPELERATLHNLGAISGRRDERRRAIEYFEKALALRRTAGAPRDIASTLGEMGALYQQWGDYRRALDLHRESLQLARQANHRLLEGSALANIGRAQLGEGDLPGAVKSLEEGLEISRAIGDKALEANILSCLGEARLRAGELEPAIERLRSALLVSREAGVKYWQVLALGRLAEAYLRHGDVEQAEAAWTEASDLARAYGSMGFEAMARHGLARIALSRGDPGAALQHAAAVVETVERQRAGIFQDDLKTAYFASARDYYQTYIDALIALDRKEPGRGHAARALQVSERVHGRRVLEALGESAVDARTGADPALVERERLLRRRVRALATEQEALFRSEAPADQREQIGKRLRAALDERHDALARLRESSPAYAALVEPEVVDPAVLHRDLLEAGTTLLEYALGRERSYLWAVTSTGLAVHVLPPGERIEEAARELHVALTARAEAVAAPGRSRAAQADQTAKRLLSELSRLILPEAALAEAGTRRLVVVAEGALQLVPFSALPDPRRGRRADGRVTPLVERVTVVSAPSASWVATLRAARRGAPSHRRTLAIFADPVFERNDSRVRSRAAEPAAKAAPLRRALDEVAVRGSKRAGDLPRLPFSRAEARAAASLLPPGEALLALGFEATRERALAADLADYRFVHFATHALVNDDHPDLSGVVLSLVDERGRPRDGFLRLQDVYEMKLPADAVVLSACQSAIGKAVAGEGLLGLARGFMYAGTRQVIASLWPVDDAATAALMGRFYRALLQERRRPSEALREAQLSLASQEQWRAPYYWAGFVIQGDWP